MNVRIVLPFIIGILSQYPLAADEQNPANRNSATSIKWLTGKGYQQELDRPFSGGWSNLEFRQLLKEVAADRRIPIILDRRLDPTVQLPISVTTGSLRTGLVGIAKQAGGDATILDNFVFLGPKNATRALRTLIELRRLELQLKETAVSKPRRTELLRPLPFESADLDTPQEILQQFAGQSQIRIENPQVLPHDLWAAMILPGVSVIESLSVVLVQFDLTFRWTREGNAIELLPIPDNVSIERRHAVRKMPPSEAAALIGERFPNLSVKTTKSELIVNGLVEDHEAIAALLKGEGTTRPIRIEAPQPLKKQVFTLEAVRVPVLKLMKTLEESAVTFEYEAEEFERAGIDLETPITINVKNASADEFFKAIYEPLGVQFQIDHLTVKLTPKQKK
jgi:hypothetical protein